MIPGLLFAVYALAVARLTRLIAADKLTEPLRERVQMKLWDRVTGDRTVTLMAMSDPNADAPKLVYLLTCPWCVSVYVAAAAAPVVYWWGTAPIFFVPALALAFSHVTGLLAEMGD